MKQPNAFAGRSKKSAPPFARNPGLVTQGSHDEPLREWHAAPNTATM